MSIYEYDEVKHMRQTREEGYEEGYHTGYNTGYGSGYDSGYDTGCENGQERVNLLNLRLCEAGRTEDLIKAASDQTYQKSLFEEFRL